MEDTNSAAQTQPNSGLMGQNQPANIDTDVLAYRTIKGLLGGKEPNGVEPASCGQFSGTITSLYEAHREGGTARVKMTYNTLATASSSLAELIAQGPEEEDLSEDLPALPQIAYDLLPEILSNCCKHLTQWYERDTFLTGALGACSALLPNVRFKYGKKYYSPHLFFFILADAASGKGMLVHALKLADGVDDMLVDEYEADRKDWEEKNRSYEQSRKNQKSSPLDPSHPGPEPAEKLLRAAEDTNLPVLYKNLAGNPEGILIGSTEADIISQANRRGDFGGFSALFRQAFEHERGQKATKSEGTVRVKEPRLALVLSGTHDQFNPLITSVENGLFSRFAVYRFSSPRKYQSQRPKPEDKEFEQAVEKSKNRICDLYKELKDRTEPLYIDTPRDLWARVDKDFGELFEKTFKGAGAPGELAASVFRGAVIAFRIAAIFCVLRRFEEGVNLKKTTRLEVGKEDIRAATSLALVYVEQSMRQALGMLRHSDNKVIKSLSLTGGPSRMTGKQMSFLQALPQRFERKEAIEIGKDLSISIRSIDRWIGSWCEVESSTLKKVEHGFYERRGV